MAIRRLWIAAFLAVLSVSVPHAGELSFKRGEKDTRPEVFRKAKPRDALMAEEIARQDAWGKIAEVVAGMEVNGGIAVKDMTQATTNFTASVKTMISSMEEVDTEYYDVGIVQIKVEVPWRTISKQVEDYVRKNGGTINAESFAQFNSYPEDSKFSVWGAGAIPGTPGVEIVKALRAAEVAAAAQMVAKIEGVYIARDTTVRDFALLSDEIRSCLSDIVTNVQFVDYRILDTIVEVDAELNAPRTIARTQRVVENVVKYDKCTGCPAFVPEFRDVVSTEVVQDKFHATGKAAITEEDLVTYVPSVRNG